MSKFEANKKYRGVSGATFLCLGTCFVNKDHIWMKRDTDGFAAAYHKDSLSDLKEVKPELVLEVGKFYKTRDGRKVRIDAILPEDNPSKAPYIGMIYRKSDNNLSVHSWSKDYKSLGECLNPLQPTEIVDVWVDPPTPVAPRVPRTGEMLAWDSGSGHISFHSLTSRLVGGFRIKWEEILDNGDNKSS